jgi:hypothetical protein
MQKHVKTVLFMVLGLVGIAIFDCLRCQGPDEDSRSCCLGALLWAAAAALPVSAFVVVRQANPERTPEERALDMLVIFVGWFVVLTATVAIRFLLLRIFT